MTEKDLHAEQQGASEQETEETLPDPELSALQAKYQELEASYIRLAADLENYRRRSERQSKELVNRATESLIIGLLPVLDNFALALAGADRADGFAKGMEMIYCQLMDVLCREGLEPLESVGREFDPNLHEAVAYVEASGQPDSVVEVTRRGYKLRGKLIRPCLVKVCKHKEEQDNG